MTQALAVRHDLFPLNTAQTGATPACRAIFLHSGALEAVCSHIALPAARSGDLIFIPAGQTARLTAKAPDALSVTLYFPPEDAPADALVLRGAAAGLYDRARSCVYEGGPAGLLRLQALYCDTLALLIRHGESRILPGVRLLEEHMLENLPVSEMANACGLSENRFRTLFLEAYGMLPIDYRNMLRLKRVETLCALSGLHAAQAAVESGFNSASYYYRLYKRVYGGEDKKNAAPE